MVTDCSSKESILFSALCSNSVNANDKKTAWFKAAAEGYKDIVEILLKHIIDINAKDKYGKTALMKAAKPMGNQLEDGGHVETVKFLIENNANINLKDNEGMSAISHVAQQPYHIVIKG